MALLLVSTVVAAFLAEGILFLSGFEPGYLDAGLTSGPPYNPAVKLDCRYDYHTDDEGVFKADPAWFPPGFCPEGFRSPPLRYEETTEPRVLFLGDSFTWGSSARPIEECFVDLVRRQGYACYNTGIPGTGPNQYAFLAEKYVPEIRPDAVAVMIFLGNDLNSHFRNPMRPRVDPYHQTNQGWLYAFDLDGKQMTPEQAYRFAHDVAYQYLKDGGAFTRNFLLTTRVGTLLGVGWAKLTRWWSRSDHPATPKTVDPDYVRGALARIRAVCDRHGARMLVFLIPDHPERDDPATSLAAQRHLFDGYENWSPGNITAADFRELPDDHLNNAGHRRFADLILRVLANE